MAKSTEVVVEKSAQGSAWVAVICPNTTRVLLGKRAKEANNPGQWNLFGGGIDMGEAPIDTALRELREEAGIVLDRSRLRKLGAAPGNMSIFVLHLNQEQAKASIRLNRAEVAKAKWFDLDDLPSSLHKSAVALIHVIAAAEMAPSTAPSMRQMMDMVEANTT